MAKSQDLITWEDCLPALRNGTSYDRLGVFSGSIASKIVDGRRVLFLFYTSVSALPIHVTRSHNSLQTQMLILSQSGPSLIAVDVKANLLHFRLTLEHHGIAFRITHFWPHHQIKKLLPDGVTLISQNGKHFPTCSELTLPQII